MDPSRRTADLVIGGTGSALERLEAQAEESGIARPRALRRAPVPRPGGGGDGRCPGVRDAEPARAVRDRRPRGVAGRDGGRGHRTTVAHPSSSATARTGCSSTRSTPRQSPTCSVGSCPTTACGDDIAAAGRARVEAFAWPRIAEEYRAVYRTALLVARHRTAGPSGWRRESGADAAGGRGPGGRRRRRRVGPPLRRPLRDPGVHAPRDRLVPAPSGTSPTGPEALAVESLAARFAAKEAVMKVLRPVDVQLDWRSIEVHRMTGGWCEIRLSGQAAAMAAEAGIDEFAVSLTHEASVAAAVVVGRCSSREQGVTMTVDETIRQVLVRARAPGRAGRVADRRHRPVRRRA